MSAPVPKPAPDAANADRDGAARGVPGGGMLHAVAIAGIALLLLNDQVAKWWVPGLPAGGAAEAARWLTGKLSDVAGLLFFPLLLQAAWEIVQSAGGRSWRPSRRVLVACALATGIGFSLVQLWEPASEGYRIALGALQWPFRALFASVRGAPTPPLAEVHLTADATDLLALPAIAISVWAGWRRTGEREGRSGAAGLRPPDCDSPAER